MSFLGILNLDTCVHLEPYSRSGGNRRGTIRVLLDFFMKYDDKMKIEDHIMTIIKFRCETWYEDWCGKLPAADCLFSGQLEVTGGVLSESWLILCE